VKKKVQDRRKNVPEPWRGGKIFKREGSFKEKIRSGWGGCQGKIKSMSLRWVKEHRAFEGDLGRAKTIRYLPKKKNS